VTGVSSVYHHYSGSEDSDDTKYNVCLSCPSDGLVRNYAARRIEQTIVTDRLSDIGGTDLALILDSSTHFEYR